MWQWELMKDCVLNTSSSPSLSDISNKIQITEKTNQAYKLRRLISFQPTRGKISSHEEIKKKWHKTDDTKK